MLASDSRKFDSLELECSHSWIVRNSVLQSGRVVVRSPNIPKDVESLILVVVGDFH